MSVGTNVPAKTTQPGPRKRGGQAEADFIIPGAQRSGTIRLSDVPHTSVCGQHGFYAKNFSLAERRGLQAVEGVILGDEIGLLRVLIRRSS